MKKWLLLLIGIVSSAQDVHYSQYFMPNLWINPAMTGFMPSTFRAVFAYRNQWRSITPYPYKTFYGSIDMPLLQEVLFPDYLGVGVMVLEDRAGHSRLGTTEGLVSVAYHRSFSSNEEAPIYIGVGLQLGYGIRSFETDKLIFGSQFTIFGPDPTVPSGEYFVNTSVGFIDLNTGIWGFFAFNPHTSLFVGGSVYHLNNPQTYFYEPIPMYPRLTSYVGFITDIGTRSSIVLTFLHLRQHEYTEYTAGAGWVYYPWPKGYGSGFRGRDKSITLGMWYRIGDALYPAFRYDSQSWGFGISYDITLSSLRVANLMRGGVEVFVAFYGFKFKKRLKSRQIYCPKIAG